MFRSSPIDRPLVITLCSRNAQLTSPKASLYHEHCLETVVQNCFPSSVLLPAAHKIKKMKNS